MDHETRRKSKNIGSTKGLETKLSLRILLFLPKETTGSWARFSDRFRGVSGQLAGRSHPGEGERRRSEKPSNRSFSLHPGNRAGFFNTPEQRRFRCSKAVAGALTSRGSSRKESFKRTALKRTSPPLLPLLLSFFSALEN